MATAIYKTSDGTRVPGASSPSKIGEDPGGLIFWAWDQGMQGLDYRKTRDDAADAGTFAHMLVEAAIKNTPMEEIPFQTDGARELGMRAYGAYLEWQQQSRIKWTDSELALVSEKHGYGGTIDLIGVQEGKNTYCLGDIKTGGLYASHLCQIAAYGQLFEECTGHAISRYHLCRFSKDSGDFLHFSTDDLSDAWECFQHQLVVYKMIRQLKKRI